MLYKLPVVVVNVKKTNDSTVVLKTDLNRKSDSHITLSAINEGKLHISLE